MSRIDYKLYSKAARRFLNGPLYITAATNSLKIQMRKNSGRNKPYIWIDPSWELFKYGKSVLSSATYPDHNGPLYIYKHRMWCKKKRQIDGRLLISVKLNSLGVTVLKMSGGYELCCYGYDLELIDDENYDSWYADAS